MEIEIYWVQAKGEPVGTGYMKNIILPNGEILLFDEEKGIIDVEPLHPFIGSECKYYANGIYKWTRELEGISINEDGIKQLDFGRPLAYA